MKSIRLISTMDTHTAGAPTRVITSGLPTLKGDTIKEKMMDFQDNHDNLRKFLLAEPRGHRDMSAAILTDTKQAGADLGLIFLTHSGYQNMCVTSTMGALGVACETGFLNLNREESEVTIETVAGMVHATLQKQSGFLHETTLQSPPAFLFAENVELIHQKTKSLLVDIAFSSVFFVLLDVTQTGMIVTPSNSKSLVSLSLEVLELANLTFRVAHPLSPAIQTIDMLMAYEKLDASHYRNLVIQRSGSVDRSPCGAGIGALSAALYAKKQMMSGQKINVENYLGTRFSVQFNQTVTTGGFSAIIPEVTGQAFITGLHQFILEEGDPYPLGLNP